MQILSPQILFKEENFKNATWSLYSYTVTSKAPTRKVDVLAPLRLAAELGVGAQKDERFTCKELTGLEAKLRWPGKKIKPEELTAFFGMMEKNMNAGISVVEAIRRCAASARTAYFRGVLGSLSYSLSPLGYSLSRGLRLFPDIFTEDMIAQIEGGESTGQIASTLGILAEAAREEMKTTKKVKGLMVYPIIVGIGIIGLMCLVQFVVIPRMMPLFKEMLKSGLPLSTRIVMGITDVCKTKPYIPAAPVIGTFLFFRNRRKIFANPAVQRLVIGKTTSKIGDMLRLLILIRSLRTLALLLSAGVSLDKTFQIVARVSGNVVYADYFLAIHKRVKDGADLDTAFFAERTRIGDHGLDIAQQIQIGVTNGSPAPGLLTLVNTMQSELAVLLEALPTIINLVMLLSVMPFLILSALAILEPSLAMAQDATRAASGR